MANALNKVRFARDKEITPAALRHVRSLTEEETLGTSVIIILFAVAAIGSTLA